MVQNVKKILQLQTSMCTTKFLYHELFLKFRTLINLKRVYFILLSNYIVSNVEKKSN